MRATFAAIQELIAQSRDNLTAISKLVHEQTKPRPGAYGFFNHTSQCLERLGDVGRVLNRLYDGRERLTQLAIDERHLTPRDWPTGTPYPENVQKVMRARTDLGSYMKQDVESLYVFSIFFLDQLALVVIHLAGLKLKKHYPFNELVEFLQREGPNPLAVLWQAHKADLLWLQYHLKFYRNKFIEHPNRPWQRGTTASVYGEEFNLFIPTPPGWDDDDAIDREIRMLVSLAPEHIQRAPDDYWEKAHPGRLIEILFNNIERIELRSDREKVLKLFSRKGGSTPTFQAIGHRVLQFAAKFTRDLIPFARANSDLVDLGLPFKYHDER